MHLEVTTVAPGKARGPKQRVRVSGASKYGESILSHKLNRLKNRLRFSEQGIIMVQKGCSVLTSLVMPGAETEALESYKEFCHMGEKEKLL